jgi:CRISPR-associated endonuclease/helicase Cas3
MENRTNTPHPIAHVRESDRTEQTLLAHLEGTANRCAQAAAKIGLGTAGELIGLLHDLGKYSDEFQSYLRSVTGIADQDGDEDGPVLQRGKVDHSTAGAQLAWRELCKAGPLGQIVGQTLALCIASHHSGLIDCLKTDPVDGPRDDFTRRMLKLDARTHFEEARIKLDAELEVRISALIHDESLIAAFKKSLHAIAMASPEKSDRTTVAQFQVGLLVRFLFSCLIAADRQDTADFERPRAAGERQHGLFLPWQILSDRLEAHLATFQPRHPIDRIRQDISQHCLEAATRSPGIFTLTVPTGGGKTLASLRFALQHARIHNLDRVVYVVPFTTIIDQNAEVARKILEPASYPEDKGRVVLEHHSNLDPIHQGWKNKLLAEDWDAPVVYTTSVQFLEALFGGGTRGARRMHQLARSVIVFDEIQSLPVRCIHLFNNAINFLTDHCGSTVVLCTATQPLLGKVDAKLGAAKLSPDREMIPNVTETFAHLRRVEVKDQRKPGGWSVQDIAALADAEVATARSCLIVVNTKKAASALFRALQPSGRPVFHLSTSMCPAHRKASLAEIHDKLKVGAEVLCVSTQLIEAGVDIDFGSVVRFAAGLDSIAQAAGRCNRNGSRAAGFVHIVNPAEESLSALRDIDIAQQKTDRVLDDFRQDPGKFDHDLLSPKAMECFYENYFFARKKEMSYPVGHDRIGHDDTLLDLLSTNPIVTEDFKRAKHKAPAYLGQSFKMANQAFQAIDAPTQGVVVPYGERGRKLVSDLCAATDLENQHRLLRAAQQFTVNVFPHDFRALSEAGALHEVQPKTDIYCLNERYYSRDFGLSTEPVSPGEFLYVEQAQKHD